MLGNIGFTELLIIFVILFVGAVFSGVLPYWMIYKKTGQSGALSLLMLIPFVNIIMLFVLAFGQWPIERELIQLRRKNSDDTIA